MSTRRGLLLCLLLGGLGGCSPAQEWYYQTHDSQGAPYSPSGANGRFASVDQFRYSIGVVVRNSFGNTSYGDAGALIARLREAGISHLVGGMWANPDPSWATFNQYIYNYINQFQRAGITWALGIGAPNDSSPGTPAQVVAAVDAKIDPGMVDGFVYPNEYDISGDPNWAANEAKFGADEYAAVKQDPVVGDRPVIGPSFVNPDSPQIFGNQTGAIDIGGIHPYTQCESPAPAHDQSELAIAHVAAPGKPVWATEVGNTTAVNEPSDMMRPCSENVQAVYALRTYLQHFVDGIGRTYMNELAEETPDPSLTDSRDHFGLLRSDYSGKPAFVAIKNMLSTFGSGAPVTPAPLQMSLSGDAAGDLQYLVLQRANGTYSLALWRTVSIWDQYARKDISVTPEQISVGLPTATTVTASDPITGSGVTGMPAGQGHVSIPVGADPVILSVATSTTSTGTTPSGTTTTGTTSTGTTASGTTSTGTTTTGTASEINATPAARATNPPTVAGTPITTSKTTSTSAATTTSRLTSVTRGPATTKLRASLASINVHRGGHHSRRLTAKLSTNDTVTVRARLVRHGVTIGGARGHLRRGEHSISVLIPSRIRAGKANLILVVTDGHGHTRTLTHAVNIPARR